MNWIAAVGGMMTGLLVEARQKRARPSTRFEDRRPNGLSLHTAQDSGKRRWSGLGLLCVGFVVW